MTESDCIPVPPSVQNLIGDRYGRLVVIGYIGSFERYRKRWLCRCDCGNTSAADGGNLRAGNTKSCGCFRDESRVKNGLEKGMQPTHGMTGTAEYHTWCGIKKRCRNTDDPGYEKYGGRGIDVCDRWYDSFKAFYEDVGASPSPAYSLDRIDNNGNYEPNNCPWATLEEQARNKRNNHLVTFNGETLTVVEWAEKAGLNYQVLLARLNRLGWSVDRALTTPKMQKPYYKRGI